MAAVCVRVSDKSLAEAKSDESTEEDEESEYESDSHSSSSFSKEHRPEKVPLTVLTGFLGAGKSTLVDCLLKQMMSKGLRVAVVQNEMGPAGGLEQEWSAMDSDTGMTSVVELGGGCVCCTVKGDLLAAAEKLCEEGKMDYIMVECSGAADPSALIEMFWVDLNLESPVYLDSVVCVCDSVHLLDDLMDENKGGILRKQLVFADCVILNKLDLISQNNNHNNNNGDDSGSTMTTMTTLIEEAVYKVNSLVSIQLATRSDIRMDTVLFRRSFDGTNQNIDDFRRAHIHHHDHDHDHSEEECEHHRSGVSNVLFTEQGRLMKGEDSVEEWLSDLLWGDTTITATRLLQTAKSDGDPSGVSAVIAESSDEMKEKRMELWRVKGVLLGKDGFKYFVQSVQELFEINRSDQRWTDLTRDYSSLVFIGINLDRDVLHSGFQSILEKKD